MLAEDLPVQLVTNSFYPVKYPVVYFFAKL